MDIRLYKKSAGVYTDISTAKDYYGSGITVPMSSAEYIYIISPFKFNSFYVKLGIVSTAVSTIAIELWTGTTWESVAYIDDGTSGFTKNGAIFFSPNKYTSWNNDDSDRVDSALPMLYLQYYIRIKFSVSLSPSPKISYLGHLFLDSDVPLTSEYPVLASSNLKTAYKSGKTDWEEQRYVATQLIIEDLTKKNVICSPNQLLDISRLKMITISKTAQLIFSGMGDDYIQQSSAALKEYQSRIHNMLPYVDEKNTAIVDNTIRMARTGTFSR